MKTSTEKYRTGVLTTLGLLTVAVLVMTLFACRVKQQDSKDEISPKLAQASKTQDFPRGWLRWRGPDQNGFSAELGLPDRLDMEKDLLWSVPLSGKGTPLVSGDRAYAWGYRGKGNDLQEVLVCLDMNSGKQYWEIGFSDFISDIIYERYSVGSPALDPQTGRLYVLSSAGLLSCVSPEGELLWQHSLMESFGRLTFPNGRTGSPVVEDGLVITLGITSFWGREGPAHDRFWAFDKSDGRPVWSSTPGVQPQDSSFSTPVFATWKNQRVFFAGTGCGQIVCVNARTGSPLWRYPMSSGGVNSSVVVEGDVLIAVHGQENLEDSTTGGMLALDLGKIEPAEPGQDPVVVGAAARLWQAEISMFTSSPTLIDGKVIQMDGTGTMHALDSKTGRSLWTRKLAHSQLHASPLAADGKLYMPMENGHFFILRSEDGEILCDLQLEGNGLGAPALWRGRMLVHTSEKLYCFGPAQAGPEPSALRQPDPAAPAPGPAKQLLVVPCEVAMVPGAEQLFELRAVDAVGEAGEILKGGVWEKFIPPSAKVRVEMDAGFDGPDRLVAAPDSKNSAGAFKVQAQGLQGTMKGRLLPGLNFATDFENFELAEKAQDGSAFAHPPLPWLGARFKWEIRDIDGNKVLAKTLDKVLFQRALTFLGHEKSRDYVMQVDVMSEGDRRSMSSAGLIHQRYIVALEGNWQILEISSNHDRLKVSVPFAWKPKRWYRLKSRVESAADGSGVVRAKAWPREEAEPEAWTLEVPLERAHTHGAPGLFGFSPQNRQSVYLDNLNISPQQGVR